MCACGTDDTVKCILHVSSYIEGRIKDTALLLKISSDEG